MKKSFMILFVVLLFCNIIPQWEEQSIPGTYNLKSIYFLNTESGWAAGANGIVLNTTNGGTSWNIQQTGINSTINSIFFPDASNGYCAGDNGLILKSTDGGNSWDTTYAFDPKSVFYFPPDYHYFSLHFTDLSHGYAVGYFYEDYNPPGFTLYSFTTDGGISWNSIKFHFPGNRINDVYFIDKNLGWLSTEYDGGYGWIFKTTDGGDSWTDITPDSLIDVLSTQENFGYGTANFRSVSFINEDTGWVAGDNLAGAFGFILNTTDGGRTWNSQHSGDAELIDVAFIDPDNGWSIGNYNVYSNPASVNLPGQSNKNTYSYKSFSNTKSPDINIKNNDHKFKLGTLKLSTLYSEIIRKGRSINSTDGGRIWNAVEFNTTLSSISYVDKEHRWIAGNGKIYKYIPGAGDTLWHNSITVSDKNRKSQKLIFGQIGNASDGIDLFLGEEELPAVPSEGTFDARFILPQGSASIKDYRSPGSTQLNWIIDFQTSTSGYPVTLNWDKVRFPEGNFYLKDMITGKIINVDMKKRKSVVISKRAISQLQIYTSPKITSLSAALFDNSIVLTWKSMTEDNDQYFEIERKIFADWELIGKVYGHSMNALSHDYSFNDNLNYPAAGKTISYRLKHTEADGSSGYSEQVEVTLDTSPDEFVLFQNFPNPFNPVTTIRYGLPYESRVVFEFYNIVGEKIMDINQGIKSKGYHQIIWNPGNFTSGIYFYKIISHSVIDGSIFTKTHKMILMK